MAKYLFASSVAMASLVVPGIDEAVKSFPSDNIYFILHASLRTWKKHKPSNVMKCTFCKTVSQPPVVTETTKQMSHGVQKDTNFLVSIYLPHLLC